MSRAASAIDRDDSSQLSRFLFILRSKTPTLLRHVSPFLSNNLSGSKSGECEAVSPAVVCLCVLTVCVEREYEQMVMAIQCSRMFDGERFSAGDVTVLVAENGIVGVESGFLGLGEQWRVVRYHDATVLPGLIDTHTHLVGDSRPGALDRVPGLSDDELDQVISESFQRQLAAGVTTVRDLGDRRYAVVDRRDRQKSGHSTAREPTIVAAGPPITSRAGHCYYLGGEVDGPAAISAAIRERVERRVDVVKVMVSGGMSTPGTDVLGTQFSTEDLRFMVEQVHAQECVTAQYRAAGGGTGGYRRRGLSGALHVSDRYGF